MFNVGEYLKKFELLYKSKNFLIKSVAETIKEVCGIDIESQKIEIKNCIARIKEKPIIKNEIFLKKTKILEILNKKTNLNIKDII